MIRSSIALKRWQCVMCAMAILGTVMPGMAQDLPSRSMSEAQRRGTLLRAVAVSPQQFTWQGQKVSVLESWLEKTSQGEDLCFKLGFDGKPEFRSNEQQTLVFRDDSQNHTTLSVGEFVCGRKWTPSAMVHATLPGLSLKAAYICRMAQVKLPEPKSIRLRAGSLSGSKTGAPIMTDIVLTFDLTGGGNNGTQQ